MFVNKMSISEVNLNYIKNIKKMLRFQSEALKKQRSGEVTYLCIVCMFYENL